MGRAVLPLSFGTIDTNVFQADEKPFRLTFRMGGLYDTHVEKAASEEGEKVSDAAVSLRLGASYDVIQGPGPGLRLDYSGSARFYRQTDDELLDNTLSIVPHYTASSGMMFSLPVSAGYATENGYGDYYRYAVSPSVMYLLPGASQAVTVYVSASRINDTDKMIEIDEDGVSTGIGAGWYAMLTDTVQTKFFIDYTRVDYDVPVKEYMPEIEESEKRSDTLVSAGVDIQWQVSGYMGLFSSFTWVRSDSNTPGNDYDRGIWEMGVMFTY